MFAAGGLASAYIAPTIGEATLVPPKTVHPPEPYESYTATPVAGSASAETSATVRRTQPLSVWKAGFASYLEQPLPAPSVADVDQTDSVQPRALLARVSEVPPTAVTHGELAGYSTL